MGKIVKGGLVIDGTGALPRQVDIKIEKGRIVEIGDIKKGGKEINATGLTVMPGLIEGHNHPFGEREFSDPGFKKYYDNMVNSPALAATSLHPEIRDGVYCHLFEPSYIPAHVQPKRPEP